MEMGHVLIGIRTVIDQQIDAVLTEAGLAQRGGDTLDRKSVV